MADYTGIVYQEISVDVSEPNQFAPILVAQGDAYTRGLKITMTQHGEKLNIPNAGVTAALNACNMADNSKKASAMAEIGSDGTITAVIPSVVMEAAGYVQCDVSVIGSDGSNTTILKSTVFYLNCEASADTDGSSQPPEDDVITAAIAKIAGKVDSSVYNEKIGEIEDDLADINSELDLKTDKATTFTQGEIEMRLSNKADKSSVVKLSDYTQKIGEIEQDINGLDRDIDNIDLQLDSIEQSLSNKADISHTHPVDDAFSLTSTNPIQNVVVTRKINEIVADANNNFSNVNTQLSGKADKSSTYTKEDVDEVLSDKADYVRDIGVNNCVNLGTIYKTNVNFGGDILQAMVISANDTVEGKLTQFAFTENGKILYRTKLGSSWSGSDLFKELGSE